VHANRRTLARSLALTFPNRHSRCVPIRINVEAVIARPGYGERQVLRVNLINFAAIKLADVHIQRALMQLHLHCIIGDIGQRQTAFGAYSHHPGAKIQLSPRIFVRPNIVPDRQRTVQRTLNPIARALRLHRNRSRRIAQLSNPARGVRLLRRRLWHRLSSRRRRRLRITRLIPSSLSRGIGRQILNRRSRRRRRLIPGIRRLLIWSGRCILRCCGNCCRGYGQ
jgi:hypothetical protein